ncbi:MAG: ATP-binding protein [Allosphingosinicella sp.]|uniref:BbrUII/HgiDII family restriction enzyme n=1 Tax=Allosphingosinicella sp. TaxID=2823234 RepID=UPI00392744D7
MTAPRELVMTISLNALEHLGINLYSNIPAVLSEIVANAWDADAENVKVVIDKGAETITIEDDGTGMDRDGVIDRFLTVGFKRRDVLGGKTPKGRSPMGRKGIGKLSIFSIAQVAEVYTIVGGEKTAFRMDREVIRKAIAGAGQASYKPDEIGNWPADLKKGTRIVLSKISRSLSGMTVEGLKRRVARRFAVIGPKNDFNVTVNGNVIGPEDRAYHNALQYLWTYGDQTEFVKLCKNLERPADDRSTAVKDALKKAGLSLTGWIGTVAKPDQLKDEDGDNLNRLAVFMRGKMAQEDILDEFGQKEIYADYVIGELHCEELDLDSAGDIATSSRQSLKQDDPRFEALRTIVLAELRNIAGRWSEWRRTDGAKAAATVPAVSDWLGQLTGDTKKKAERWIGRLNTIRSNDEGDKKELLKASILAFESYRRKEELDRLEDLKDESIEHILEIFKSIDDLELSYYGQIVKLRIGVIRTLQDKLKKNDKELVLRDYIFDHLWLLDPSWERTKGSEHAETLVQKFLDDNTAKLKGKAKTARIDIGYRTTGGKHVIVELKRASVAVPVDELARQIRTYRDGAKKILEKTTYKNWPIEIICLLGKPPPEWNDASGTGPTGVIDTLKTVDARIVFYDELLTNAESAYADYLDEHVKVDKLWGVFEAIDDFTPPKP